MKISPSWIWLKLSLAIGTTLLLVFACAVPSAQTSSPTSTFLPTVIQSTSGPTTQPTAPQMTAIVITPPAQPTASPQPTSVGGAIPVYGYTVVNSYPHDPQAFTQGLVYDNGVLYEGTGLNGRSSLRRVDLQTGQVQQNQPLDSQYFGEGIALLNGKIFQLTWQNHVGFIYNKDTFAKIGEFSYQTEGWGLTTDGKELIMSDGTSNIYFLDPDTLKETHRIAVSGEGGGPVTSLNELEYVNGEIYANLWRTDKIARIDPTSGQVLGWIDLTGLLKPEDRTQPVDVLNGIAYDPATDRLFVTGKLWPKLFEIDLVKK